MDDNIFWAVAINGTLVGPFGSRVEASAYIDSRGEDRWIVAPDHMKDGISAKRKKAYYNE